MPLFGKQKKKDSPTESQPPPVPTPSDHTNDAQSQNGADDQRGSRAPKFQFHCQLAQGSPTGIISGFTNVKELYQRIADAFDINVAVILFCTLNTHKVDMNKLLGGQIGLDDFIFAHVKGQPKEIEVHKGEDALGLTITDNGAGYAFIKRKREGSIMDKIDLIYVGDHIEKINGKSVVGCRHYEVAKMLKDIPKGETFTIRLIEPEKSTLSNVGPPNRNKGASSKGLGTGKATIRLRANGPATVENELDQAEQAAVKKIDQLLESYMGVADLELAQSIWEMGKDKSNPSEFTIEIDNNLGEFGFTDDFIFDLWGAIGDAKSGRLAEQNQVEFNEQF